MDYVFPPRNWTINDSNPFDPDGKYGDRYSCFSTKGKFKYDKLTKRTKNGCWLLMYNEKNDGYIDELVYFIEYENINGRSVIIDSNQAKEEIEAIIVAGENDFKATKYLVHSTTEIGWNRIEKSGKITADYFLKERSNYNSDLINDYMNNEPKEYCQYVDLADMEWNSEIVVAAHQYGKFITDESIEYVPGIRIYLDFKKMKNDGIIVYDGVHYAKVYKEIDVRKYMVKAIGKGNFKDINKWSPKLFMEMSNYEIENSV
jgi:hypothetical protein